MTPAQRAAIYAAATAISAVAVTYGVIQESEAAVLLSAFSSLLGVVTAFLYRPTGPRN